MRLRNARKPNRAAKSVGTATEAIVAKAKLRKGGQYHVSWVLLRKTMKSGSSLWYCPSSPMWSIRYMPKQYPPSEKNTPCPRLRMPV
jgi:hypothetical protein